MATQCQRNSTSAKLPALLIPVTSTSSRRATLIGTCVPPWVDSRISDRKASTPCGDSTTSQHGGGSTPAGHFCCVPMIHPWCCKTSESGELKSLLETMPVLSQNTCGALKASDPEMRSAARRLLRKSRGEHAGAKHNATVSRSALEIRMNADYCRVRILTNCARWRGRKGCDAICPSNWRDHRPGSAVRHAGQLPSGVRRYSSIMYP